MTGKCIDVADMMRKRNIHVEILCLENTKWMRDKLRGDSRVIGNTHKLYYNVRGNHEMK